MVLACKTMLPGPQPSIQVCLVPYLALFVSFFFQPMMAPRKRGRQLSPAVSASDFADTSVASSPAPNSATETVSKKVKFNRRFKTDTTCDDDVLSGFGSAKVNILTRSSERQKATWNSDVYDHFKPPAIIDENGEVAYVFVCKKYVADFLPSPPGASLNDHWLFSEPHPFRSPEFGTTTAQVI